MMDLTPDIDKQLRDAGYEYHCFISCPRTKDRFLSAFVKRLKEDIELYLSSFVPEPKIFLDESEIRGGDEWERAVSQALCRSITLIAVWTPIYGDQSHKWCGWEWTNMYRLSEKRLPDENFSTIIPVIVTMPSSVPEPVGRLRFYDFSRIRISGSRYYNTNEYRLKLVEIVKHIDRIATLLLQKNAIAECDDFQFVHESVFSKYPAYTQPDPFRSIS